MEQLLDLDDKVKKMTPEQQSQMIAGMRQEAALANLQSLITMLTEKCTVKCISNPGSVLSGSEKQCLQRCMDRFIESWDLVTKTMHGRMQQELSYASSSSASGLFGGSGGGVSRSMGGGPSFS